MITRNSKHVKATPIKAEQYLQDKLNKYTKTDPSEEFLKQYETHAQHTKTKSYNEQVDYSSNKTLKETCNMKAHNKITGIYTAKETQKTILITGQLIEIERIIVATAQELGMGE